MANLPADIINQALDAIGSEVTIGDPQEGTREAQVSLRAYSECLKQLLRSAHWDFARRQAPMTLLADITGQTPDVGTLVPQPWTYEYAYPMDCLKARFVPWNNGNQADNAPPGNIALPQDVPIMTGLGAPTSNRMRLRPARFLVATDYNNLLPPGENTSNEIQGISPIARTVVLTNVKRAELVYTAYLPYPTLWDSQFRAAMVAYLASEIALPLSKDKKFGMAMRERNIAIAKDKIRQARITDGNEGFYNSDFATDWMRFRNTGLGGRAWNFGEGHGVLGYGWDSCAFEGTTSAY